jgi:hypothetical protein
MSLESFKQTIGNKLPNIPSKTDCAIAGAIVDIKNYYYVFDCITNRAHLDSFTEIGMGHFETYRTELNRVLKKM